MLNNGSKLAVIASHPIQHFVPVYRRLAEQYNIEIKVFFIAENGVTNSVDKGFGVSFSWDIPLLEGYQHKFVNPGNIIINFSFNEIDCTDIHQHLEEFAADAVWLNGYWSRVNWRIIMRQNNYRTIIYGSDSNLLDIRNRTTRFIKQIIVRFFLSRCDAFIAVSEQNTRYLRHHGVSEKQIEQACYPIDMRTLLAQRTQLTPDDRQAIRNKYGVSNDAFLIIFSGKLVAYKNPIDLVKALNVVQQKEIVVMFMGDGEQRDKLQSTSKQYGLKQQVVITGFINQSEIAKHMYASDVLALPSGKEPFGAVISEALPFGLPIIASSQVGAVGKSDSAQPNQNALIYPSGNIEELALAIKQLYQNRALYKRFSEHSRAITMQHDVDVYCQALLRCLETED